MVGPHRVGPCSAGLSGFVGMQVSAREMAQSLRALAVVSENPSLVWLPAISVTTDSNSSSGNMAPSSALCRHCTTRVHLHAGKHSNIFKK